MVAAVVPPSVIAERRRLGLDKKDEMWEGVLHMNDPGSFEHQRIETKLGSVLSTVADQMGLVALVETGIFDPDVPDNSSYRTPDVLVARPGTWSERGEGRAALAIEIRSPGDDSFNKIGFYGRVGVEELLIIDRDTKAVRRWVSTGSELRALRRTTRVPLNERGSSVPANSKSGTRVVLRRALMEKGAGPDGWHRIDALPGAARDHDGKLQVRLDDRTEEI